MLQDTPCIIWGSSSVAMYHKMLSSQHGYMFAIIYCWLLHWSMSLQFTTNDSYSHTKRERWMYNVVYASYTQLANYIAQLWGGWFRLTTSFGSSDKNTTIITVGRRHTHAHTHTRAYIQHALRTHTNMYRLQYHVTYTYTPHWRYTNLIPAEAQPTTTYSECSMYYRYMYKVHCHTQGRTMHKTLKLTGDLVLKSTHTRALVHTHTHVRMHARTRTHTHTYVYVYSHAHAHTLTHAHTLSLPTKNKDYKKKSCFLCLN